MWVHFVTVVFVFVRFFAVVLFLSFFIPRVDFTAQASLQLSYVGKDGLELPSLLLLPKC